MHRQLKVYIPVTKRFNFPKIRKMQGRKLTEDFSLSGASLSRETRGSLCSGKSVQSK